jgi:putative ABC transport system permease protein
MPDWSSEIRTRLSGVRLAPAREAEIVEELSQHLEDRWREVVASGVDPSVAVQVALAEFRDRDLLARYLAPLRQAHWSDPAPAPARHRLFGGFIRDLRDGARSLRSAPGFTVAALIVLTLGIGASAAIFSVVDAVVLRSLPFDDAERLVAIGERGGGRGKAGPIPVSRTPGLFDIGDPLAINRAQPQNYFDWVAQQRVFESIAAVDDLAEFTLNLPGTEPIDLTAQRVTASFFDVLRIRPAFGRLFTADNEVNGRHRVGILSDTFWRTRFNADPGIVGRRIALGDGNYEVLGVMPPGVTYPVGAARATDLWVPYVPAPNERTREGRRHSIYLGAIARLKPGVSVSEAQAQMDQIAATLEQTYPDWNRGTRFGVRPLRDHLVGASVRTWMLMLLTAVGFVLLIACANVANLLLARSGARVREVAVRAALGASRWRLVRQLVVESLLLSAIAMVLAIVVAWWGVQVLRASMPEGIPRVTTIAVNLRVLVVTAGVSVLTALFFSCVPALQLSKPDLTSSLKDTMRAAGVSRNRQRWRSALIVVEVALAVVLLVGAALFVGSFITVMRIDPGFNPDRVITTQLYRRPQAGQRPQDISVSLAEIVDRLSTTAGVVHAAAAAPGIPLRVNLQITGLNLKGQAFTGDRSISLKVVTPAYHAALGIPLRSGRLFTAADRAGSPPVIILNEAAARVFFPGEDPVGRTVILDGRGEHTVVGVVVDARQSTLEVPARTEAYVPMAQNGASSAYLVVRTNVEPHEVLPAIKTLVFRVLPDIPLRRTATMDELIAGQAAQRRLTMLMLGLFGVLGLVISAVGIFGLMAYLVSQRTREIGVRIALGATRSHVIGMVLRNACALVAAGLVIGGVGAWYLSATAKSFLFGLEPNDPRAFFVALMSLSIAGALASIIPAQRAAGVDPVVALRAE